MTYEEILAYLESLKGTPVDLQAQMQGNPNEVNPVARGGTDVAWGNVPGLEQFYSYDQANNQENFNLAQAMPEIQRLGYQVMQAEDPGAETMASWVAGPDGKPIAQSAHLTGTNDDNFKIAAALAAALAGGATASWANGVGAVPQPGLMNGLDQAMIDVANSGAITPEWMASGAGGGGAGVNLGMGGATAADFGMIPTAGGGATYGGIGAAEAAGAAAAAGAGGVVPAASKGLLSGIGPTLLQLGGAALGAASSQDQEQTTTTKNEPWGPAQDWIKSNIAAGQALQQKYTDQPFSPGQQTAYGNLYGLLNSYNTEMLPGLLGNANAMSQGYDRYAPKETRSRPNFGAVGSTWAPGLLKFGG